MNLFSSIIFLVCVAYMSNLSAQNTKVIWPPDNTTDLRYIPGIMIAGDVGLGYRTGTIHEPFEATDRKYINNMAPGAVLSAQFQYYLKKMPAAKHKNLECGLGAKYGVYTSILSNLITESATACKTDKSSLTDEIAIHNVDVFICSRTRLSHLCILYGSIGMSFSSYVDIAKSYLTTGDYSILVLEGNTLGLNMNTGCDFLISSSVGIGIKCTYYSAQLSDVLVNSNSQSHHYPESLNRIDLSASFSYYISK